MINEHEVCDWGLCTRAELCMKLVMNAGDPVLQVCVCERERETMRDKCREKTSNSSTVNQDFWTSVFCGHAHAYLKRHDDRRFLFP